MYEPVVFPLVERNCGMSSEKSDSASEISFTGMLKVVLNMACFLSIAYARRIIVPEGRTVLVEELDCLSVIYFLLTTYGTILS